MIHHLPLVVPIEKKVIEKNRVVHSKAAEYKYYNLNKRANYLIIRGGVKKFSDDLLSPDQTTFARFSVVA